MPLNISELGLNIIQFISNLYVGVFLYIGGLVSIPCMLEKDCNGNPISNFPPCYAFQMNWPLGRFSLKVVMSVIGKKNFETVVQAKTIRGNFP